MFDLFRSRQKAVRYVLGGILMVIAISMVVTLIPGYGTSSARSTDDSVIATIGPDKMTAQEVLVQAQRDFAGHNMPPEMLPVYMPQMIDSMIQQRALVYEFKQLGITASDDEIYADIAAAYPSFFPNGAMTPETRAQFESALAANGQTLQNVIEGVRQDVINRKVQDLALERSVVSPKEVDEAVAQKFDKAKIDYVAFAPAKFRDQVKATPEELKAYFDSHKTGYGGAPTYTLPEKRSFQVVVLDQEKIAQTIDVTDAQLHAAYAGNMDNFRTPERVHARHILVMTQGKPDSEKPQLLAKAQDVLKQLKSGGDFAKLAEKYSDDKSNAPKGGDLGWIVRGQMVPEFENAVFALKPGETSGIVTTQYGYHIAQVLEHEQARVKPFDEVKAQLAGDLRNQQVSDKMQSLGDEIHAALEKAPGSAADIAKKYGAEEVTVTDAEKGQAIPTLGVSPEIDNALAGVRVNGVTPVLTLPANRLAIAVLTADTPVKPAELKDVESKVKDDYTTQKSREIASEKAKEAAAKINGGEDMAKVAKSMGLTMSQPAAFSRADSIEGLGSASSFNDAFTKPVGAIVGPTQINNGDILPVEVIYKIVDQQHVDPAKLPGERAQILLQLKQQKGIEEFRLFQDGVFAKLVAEKKVVIHKDVIKRVLASLQQQQR